VDEVKTRRLATVSLVALLFIGGMIAVFQLLHSNPPKAALAVGTNSKPTPVILPKSLHPGRAGQVANQAGRVANVVMPQDLPPPRPWLRVDFTLQLDAPTAALYQQMVTLMGGYTAVPNDRLNYFSAVLNNPDFVLERWGGLLSNVQPNPMGGYLLTVKIGPQLSSPTSQPMIFNWNYGEQFSVDANNNIQYVGFLDPDNGAGKLPGMSAIP